MVITTEVPAHETYIYMYDFHISTLSNFFFNS